MKVDRTWTLTPYTQPIRHLKDGTLAGVEALARWISPSGGVVTPADAFAQGVDPVSTSRQMLSHAIRLLRDHPGEWWLSVNLPAVLFGEPGLATRTRGHADDCGVTAARLVIELTEEDYLGVSEKDAAGAWRQAGMRVAVDDYGTGHATSERVRSIQPDLVKADISVLHSADPAAALHALVEVAGSVAAHVVVEGVETPAHAQIARQHGILLGQGWLLGRPAPVAQHLSGLAAR